MLIPDVHLQFPYPGWQRADSTSRWALSNPCCPTALRPCLQPVGEKPCPGWFPGEPPHKVQVTGYGETGSKWGRQTLTEGVWLSVHVKVWDRILQSQTRLASPKMGISGRTDWESTENTILLEKEPFLTVFSSSFSSGHPQATGGFRGVSRKWKTCSLMLRVNTAPSCVPTTHTGRTSPCGTDSSLSHAVSGRMQDSQLQHRVQHRHFSTRSLASHSPPGEASCTQQQGAPQLTWNPFHCLFSRHSWTRGLKSRDYWAWASQQKRAQAVKPRTLSIQNGDQEPDPLGKTYQQWQTLCSWGMIGKEVTKERSHLTGSSSLCSQLTARYLRSLRGCALVWWGDVSFICI